MILEEILSQKKNEVERQKKAVALEALSQRFSTLPPIRSLKEALSKPGLSLIAELKKASPSAGVIRKDFNPVYLAKIYEEGEAAAISVLTESNYFQGSLDYLEKVKGSVSIPVLRKDFIIDEYQVYESRACGADAILLIVAALDSDKLNRLLSLAKNLGLDALVEVHNRRELDGALKVGAEIIGVNNRNLRSLEVNLSVTPRLARFIPKGKVVVSESGISSRRDIEFLQQTGRIDAVLVGESLMRSDDIRCKMRELLRGVSSAEKGNES